MSHVQSYETCLNAIIVVAVSHIVQCCSVVSIVVWPRLVQHTILIVRKLVEVQQ